VEELRGLGIPVERFLARDVGWSIADCGVDERNCFRLKGSCGSGAGFVTEELCVAAKKAGASSVLMISCDTQTGAYLATSATDSGPVLLFETYDPDEVGEDFVAGVQRLLAQAHRVASGLVRDGLLPG
jgi:hypothetical protein